MKRFFPAGTGRFFAVVLLLLGAIAWVPAAHARTQSCLANGTNGVIYLPLGSVAFSSSTTGPVGPQLNQSITFSCPPSVFSGATDKTRMVIQALMNGGTYDAATQTWLVPTGDPNLDAQIRLVSSSPTSLPLVDGGNLYDLVSLTMAQSNWTANFTIQLIKKPGSVNPNNVPTTLVSLFNTKDGNSIDAASIGTLAIGAGTTIQSLSCIANSVTVQLPTVSKQALATSGATAGSTPIPIQVSGCEPGTQLSVALTGTPAVDPVSGVASPTTSGIVQSTGSDPNVAVQILDNLTPTPTDISGNTRRYIGQVPASGGTLSVVYYARYYALRPAQGGRVKAGLTFTLSYP